MKFSIATLCLPLQVLYKQSIGLRPFQLLTDLLEMRKLSMLVFHAGADKLDVGDLQDDNICPFLLQKQQGDLALSTF